jgi:hypothetical protein
MPQKKYVHNSVSSAGITQIRFKGYLLSPVGTPAQFLIMNFIYFNFFIKSRRNSILNPAASEWGTSLFLMDRRFFAVYCGELQFKIAKPRKVLYDPPTM